MTVSFRRMAVLAAMAALAGCANNPPTLAPRDRPRVPPVPRPPVGIGVGSVAPELTGKTLDGRRVRLSAYRGKTVVLNVFSPSCIPCREEYPELIALARRKAGRRFAVLSVCVQARPGEAAKFRKQFRPPFPIVVPDRDPGDAFDLSATPTNIVIGPDGRITKRFDGMVPAAEWARL